jgi:hypothetical protein
MKMRGWSLTRVMAYRWNGSHPRVFRSVPSCSGTLVWTKTNTNTKKLEESLRKMMRLSMKALQRLKIDSFSQINS